MTLRILGIVPCVVVGYLLTVAIETPVLFLGLQRHRYTHKQKLLAGFCLTGFTYPFVCFIFPAFMDVSSPTFVWVAETFAPLAEAIIFWLWFGRGRSLRSPGTWRDIATVVAANVVSFAVGESIKGAGLIEFVS